MSWSDSLNIKATMANHIVWRTLSLFLVWGISKQASLGQGQLCGVLVLAQSASDCFLPPRNKLFGKHCAETIVGVITGLVLSHFAMLVPLHSCWHPDPAQSSAALFHGATASLEAHDA